MSDFRRQRGIYTPLQIKGFELLCAGAVKDNIEDGVLEVHVGKHVRIVGYDRHDCNCDRFTKSHPRTACEHMWAAYYMVEPPTEEEVADLRKRLAGETLEAQAKSSVRSRLPVSSDDVGDDKIAAVSERLVRGGYKRFASDYNRALRSAFGKEMRYALRLFEEFEKMYVWKKRKNDNEQGRPNVRLSLLLFMAYSYTYLGWSIRATEGWMEFLAELGFIGKDYPLCGTLSAFLRSHEATVLLDELIAISAEPFRDLGPMTLVGDGTGIAADRNKFFDYRSKRCEGKEQTRPGRPWFKASVISNVDTLHSVMVHVTNNRTNELRTLREMLPILEARDYDIESFLYDGAGNDTLLRDDIIERLHALPFIPWNKKQSKTSIPKKWRGVVKHAEIITELHRLCFKDPERFKEVMYRYRPKVECLFSAVKEKFGSYVRTIKGAGPTNEIMLKFLAYNIWLLVLAAQVYGLDTSLSAPVAA